MTKAIVTGTTAIEQKPREFFHKGHKFVFSGWKPLVNSLAFIGQWEAEMLPEESKLKTWIVIWSPDEQAAVEANGKAIANKMHLTFDFKGWQEETPTHKVGLFKYAGGNKFIPPLRWWMVWAPTEEEFHAGCIKFIKGEIGKELSGFDSDAWFEENVGTLTGIRKDKEILPSPLQYLEEKSKRLKGDTK